MQDFSNIDNFDSPKHFKLSKNNIQSNQSSSSPGFGVQSKITKKTSKEK